MEISEFQKRLTDEANCLRGKIIAGYSLVEYVLADISVLLDLHFPYSLEDRIKAVKKIVDRPEYEAYRTDFHRVCDEFPRYEELRHFIAHGAMVLRADSKFELQLYKRLRRSERKEGRDFRRDIRQFSMGDFRRHAAEMVRFTSDAYAVFYKFYLEQDVENVRDGR
jgi:hypothetical protein